MMPSPRWIALSANLLLALVVACTPGSTPAPASSGNPGAAPSSAPSSSGKPGY